MVPHPQKTFVELREEAQQRAREQRLESQLDLHSESPPREVGRGKGKGTGERKETGKVGVRMAAAKEGADALVTWLAPPRRPRGRSTVL